MKHCLCSAHVDPSWNACCSLYLLPGLLTCVADELEKSLREAPIKVERERLSELSNPFVKKMLYLWASLPTALTVSSTMTYQRLELWGTQQFFGFSYWGFMSLQRLCRVTWDSNGYFCHLGQVAAIRAVGGTKASSIWSVVSARKVCWWLFKVNIAKVMNVFLFSSAMNVHCDVFWILDKHALQYAAFSMVERASKLAVSKNNASENARDDREAVWLIDNTGTPEVFLAEADELGVDPFLTALMSDLWDDHDFPFWFWGFDPVGFVCLDVTSCPHSRSKDVVWKARSPRFVTSLLPP